MIFKCGNLIIGSFFLPRNTKINIDSTLIEFPFKSKFEIRFGSSGDNIYFMIIDKYLKTYGANKEYTEKDNYVNFIFCIE